VTIGYGFTLSGDSLLKAAAIRSAWVAAALAGFVDIRKWRTKGFGYFK
jgi:hypothetical protein